MTNQNMKKETADIGIGLMKVHGQVYCGPLIQN